MHAITRWSIAALMAVGPTGCGLVDDSRANDGPAASTEAESASSQSSVNRTEGVDHSYNPAGANASDSRPSESGELLDPVERSRIVWCVSILDYMEAGLDLARAFSSGDAAEVVSSAHDVTAASVEAAKASPPELREASLLLQTAVQDLDSELTRSERPLALAERADQTAELVGPQVDAIISTAKDACPELKIREARPAAESWQRLTGD